LVNNYLPNDILITINNKRIAKLVISCIVSIGSLVSSIEAGLIIFFSLPQFYLWALTEFSTWMSYSLLVSCRYDIVTDLELDILQSTYVIILLYLQEVVEKMILSKDYTLFQTRTHRIAQHYQRRSATRPYHKMN